MTEPSVLETAQKYTTAGLSVIPVKTDKTKRPEWDRLPKGEDGKATWKPFQREIAGPDELNHFFGNNGVGIAIVCGRVSGNLEDIDFDDLDAYRKWNDLLIAQGAKDLLDRLTKVQTPRPGVAVLYRCLTEVEGSQKLAMRLEEGEQKCMIETRGEGGYFIGPGSPLEVHKTKRPYLLKRGDICNPSVITAAERALLLEAAKSLNEYVEPANVHKPLMAQGGNGSRPGDEFNARATWAEILEAGKWKRVFTSGDVGYWRRPGKSEGSSATTNYGGSDLLYVFSSNAPHFDPGHSYSKFAAYARLNHGGDYQAAARELSAKGYGTPHQSNRAESQPDAPAEEEQPLTVGWKLYDAGAVAEWPQDPLVWLVDGLIPKGGIGFMSAPPKDRKSLLTLDLALHLVQPEARSWLGKFKVTPTKVLYIAREDPLRRVQERMVEICKSYGMSLPEPGRLQFLVRERIHLTESEHRTWLKDTIRAGGFELLILDVINRMHPELDEISAKDMGCLVGILEELNRDLGITVLSDDHTRKPQGRNTGRDNQEPNPFDMKGSIAKYGAADFMICLSRTPQENRMQVYCENKDSDERPRFFLDVSPKGSAEPKFTYGGNIEKAAADMKKVGEDNRARVLAAFTSEWSGSKEVTFRTNLGGSAVSKHIAHLVMAGKLEQKGTGRATRYRLSSERGENAPRTNSDKGLYDNE